MFKSLKHSPPPGSGGMCVFFPKKRVILIHFSVNQWWAWADSQIKKCLLTCLKLCLFNRSDKRWKEDWLCQHRRPMECYRVNSTWSLFVAIGYNSLFCLKIKCDNIFSYLYIILNIVSHFIFEQKRLLQPMAIKGDHVKLCI